MHRVSLLPSAVRDLEGLERRVFARMDQAIRYLAQEPRPPGTVKLTDREGYRIRVGDYRILYRIDDRSKAVFIYRVKHRREVYR